MDDWLDDLQSVRYDASQTQFDYQLASQPHPGHIIEGTLTTPVPCHMQALQGSCLRLRAPADVDGAEVIKRIESCVLAFLEEIFLHGAAPDISLVRPWKHHSSLHL